MKKIVVIGSDPRLIGGAETFSRTLISVFKDIHFLSIYSDKKNNVFDVDNVYCSFEKNILFRILNKVTKNKISFIILRHYIKKINPDVAILNSPMFLPIAKDIDKIILRQHTCADMLWKMPVQFNKSNKLLKESKKHFFAALSPQEKFLLNEKFGIENDRIHVIRNSCTIKSIQTKKIDVKKLIIISRLDNSIKRIDLAINAMLYLKEYQLHIYGAGIDAEYIKALSQKHNNVFVHPATNKIISVLDECSIFINCSEFEGYPITCIEASRRGLPIILRNTFPSAEDIISGNGVLLDKEWDVDNFVSAVKFVSKNYVLMSQRSLELSEKFDQNIINKKWVDLVSGG